MLFGINTLTLVHTFTRHWHGRSAIWTSILSLSVSCPLWSFCHHWFGRAKEYERFWWSNCLRFPRFFSNHHKCDVTFSLDNWHVLFWFVTRVEILWNFPRLDFHFFLLRNIFFFFYLLQPFSLESKALKNSQLHPSKFSLLWISINGWFCFS